MNGTCKVCNASFGRGSAIAVPRTVASHHVTCRPWKLLTTGNASFRNRVSNGSTASNRAGLISIRIRAGNFKRFLTNVASVCNAISFADIGTIFRCWPVRLKEIITALASLGLNTVAYISINTTARTAERTSKFSSPASAAVFATSPAMNVRIQDSHFRTLLTDLVRANSLFTQRVGPFSL
jgi:hypothetical protein